MEEKSITPEQSLELINRMIHEAKQEMKDNGFFFLLWGWLVLIAAIIHYTLLRLEIGNAWLSWPVLMPLGGLVSIIYGIIHSKKKARKTKSWIDRTMAYLWSGFVITLTITLGVGGKIGFEVVYPMLMLLYGSGTFVTGGVIKFKMLIFGGIFCWLAGATAFFLDFEWQLLLLIASIIIAYIIPGHLLNTKSKNNV